MGRSTYLSEDFSFEGFNFVHGWFRGVHTSLPYIKILWITWQSVTNMQFYNWKCFDNPDIGD